MFNLGALRSLVLPMPPELSSGLSSALDVVPDAPAVIPEDYQITPDDLDSKAGMRIAILAHDVGMTPVELVRGLHLLRSQISNLEGFQEQTCAFAYTTALGVPISAVELDAPNVAKAISVANNFNGVAIVGGFLEITIFRAGNTESGEQVTLDIIGRRAMPERRQLVAGKVHRIPWGGIFAQTHQLSFSSPQGDAVNKVSIMVTARCRALTMREVVAARRFIGLRGIVQQIEEWKLSSQGNLVGSISSAVAAKAGGLLAAAKAGGGETKARTGQPSASASGSGGYTSLK